MTAQILVEKKKLANPPLKLHYLGDRVLRQPAKRISKVDDEIRMFQRNLRIAHSVALQSTAVDQLRRLVTSGIDEDRTTTWHVQRLFRQPHPIGGFHLFQNLRVRL